VAERTGLEVNLTGLRVFFVVSSELERDGTEIINEFLFFRLMKQYHRLNALCIDINASLMEPPPEIPLHKKGPLLR
jgi:hypothetical protein